MGAEEIPFVSLEIRDREGHRPETYGLPAIDVYDMVPVCGVVCIHYGRCVSCVLVAPEYLYHRRVAPLVLDFMYASQTDEWCCRLVGMPRKEHFIRQIPLVGHVSFDQVPIVVAKNFLVNDYLGDLCLRNFTASSISPELKLAGSKVVVVRSSRTIGYLLAVEPHPCPWVALLFHDSDLQVPFGVGVLTIADPTIGIPSADSISMKAEEPICVSGGN